MGLRIYYFLLLIVLVDCHIVKALASSKLLSKITITSTRALCTKDPLNSANFIFTYHENVNVTFADGSKISSDELEIIVDSFQVKPQDHKEKSTEITQKSIDHLKKITFKHNVIVSNGLRRASAKFVHVYLSDQRCLLEGNVKIWQAKKHINDIPVVATSPRAELNLKTNEFSMLGTSTTPVSTTLILEGNPSLQSKKVLKKTTSMSTNNHEKNTRSTTSRSA